ncbi:nucleotide sugar dehydrogenase [Candidatus Woesearchaeota archaeon]|nr:nucleotide sugar dehydrogenase [Candidatus Woesearchaeota archaeon]
MRVCVVGLGKAGLPLAAVIADSGIEVIGVDISQNRVDEINNGINPLPEEPGLSELIKKHGGKGLKATSDYSTCPGKPGEITTFIIIVPLFIDYNKKPDFSILKKAFESVSKVINDGDIVVLETTVPPGTTEKILKPVLDNSNKKYHLAYSPERIMTGYSISRYKEFPKVIGGFDKKSGEKAKELYSMFCKNVQLVSNIRTAEMIKVCEGVYRDVNIALANELFKVCESKGLDYYEIRHYANHEYCNLHLPGNVGGHCIPVYPWFMINEFNVPLIKLAREINDSMIDYYIAKIIKIAGNKKNVGIIGLSYREGVKEKAYSMSITLIKKLKEKGFNVFGLDPMYNRTEVYNEFGIDIIKDIANMDAIILMNNESAFRDDLLKIKDKVVDVKNTLRKLLG